MKRYLLPLAAVLATLAGSAGPILAGNVPEIATSRSQFTIPFRYDQAELGRLQAQEVLLFVSRDSGKNWRPLDTMSPQHKEFVFNATEDGIYWFSVAVRGGDQRLYPDPAKQPPGLQVTVDRIPPTLNLQLQQTVRDRVELSWQAEDAYLAHNTLELEYHNAPGDPWKKVYVNPARSGSTSWKIQEGQRPEVRGRIADTAGNVTEQSTQLDSPIHTLSLTGNSHGDRSLAAITTGGDAPVEVILPLINPGIKKAETADLENAAPLELAHATTPPVPPAPPVRAATERVPSVPQPAVQESQPQFPRLRQQVQHLQPVEYTTDTRARYLNSREFQIEYQVTGVGPSGVGVVELFITQDNGDQWWRYGVDADLVSPMEVKVPADGQYGFHFRIHSGVGNAEPPPQPGQRPQIHVLVDSSAPRLEILNVYQGHGDQLNQLTVQWDFIDQHPGDRPISLFLSGNKDGPWQPLTHALENTGTHTFRLPENAPTRVYLKVQGTDVAGNVAEAVSPEPILIDLARPTARIIMIDAIR